MQPVRVLIVSDDSWTRAGLAALLSESPGIEVIGQLSQKADFSSFQPDVLLWDGIEESGWPMMEVPVLVLLHDDAQAARALAAGARGVLLRKAETEALGAAIQALARGLVVVEPEMLEALNTEPLVDPEPLNEALTERELEVLRRLAAGRSNKVIAKELEISEHTVKFHMASILAKLGVESRTEAVVRAVQLGLILL